MVSSYLHYFFYRNTDRLYTFRTLVISLVVAGKFDVIQLGLFVTTVPEDQTNVSMIWSQNEEDQISVLVHVNDLAKNALQTGQPRHVQSANEIPVIK